MSLSERRTLVKQAKLDREAAGQAEESDGSRREMSVDEIIERRLYEDDDNGSTSAKRVKSATNHSRELSKEFSD